MIAREAAYLALLASLRQEQFIMHSLASWQKAEHPTVQDFAFAHEIATGAARMALSLDYIAEQLSTSKKLNLKLKERALLRTAIYQYHFMQKVPLYAIVNETIEIAKKYCHQTFAAYLNALLRNLENGVPALPSGNTPEELSIRYSYPLYFVRALIADYGQEETEKILTAGNLPSKTMVRVRPGVDINAQAFNFLSPLKETGVPVAILKTASSLSAIAAMPEVYIQNATSVALIAELATKQSIPPTRILDLCASPGGKLLAVHDLFPQADLYANDLTVDKVMRLSQNLAKYGVKADLTCGPGEEYSAANLFDLIILDVPCSNSGVLNKRAEARWRLTNEALAALHKKQVDLIKHAATLLAPGGVIWYITCSILKTENEALLTYASKHCGLAIEYQRTILPNTDGWDGGFAGLLKQS